MSVIFQNKNYFYLKFAYTGYSQTLNITTVKEVRKNESISYSFNVSKIFFSRFSIKS